MAFVLAACGGGSSTPPTGTQANSLSEAIAVATNNGTLPNLNRDSTVAGPDSNNNGVRDDLDAYIASLPDTAPQKAALTQFSSSMQTAMLTDTADSAALSAAFTGIANATVCVFSRYAPSLANEKRLNIRKLTANTRARVYAYMTFGQAVNGKTVALPEGDGCAN